MEDWFSEDLLPEARQARPLSLLRTLERCLLTSAVHRTCTSHAMSRALAEAYNCEPPTVLYNAFRLAEREDIDGEWKDRRSRRVPSIHWYSQTVGPGRGLEDLLGALPLLTHRVDIHLRGHPVDGWDCWLEKRVPRKFRKWIYLHPIVPNRELLSRIAEHDIGFAGEMKYSASRDLTVTNKVFQYLLAGLALVASDTQGQMEVLDKTPGVGIAYRSGDPRSLASALETLLGSREKLKTARAAAAKSAREIFCWENEAPCLLSSVETALSLKQTPHAQAV